jgi:hypothetical protein
MIFEYLRGSSAQMYLLEQALAAARTALFRAQKDTEDSFMRYTSCLDLERQARLAVLSAEKRRDDISMELINLVDNVLTQHPSGYSSLPKSTAELV